MDRRVLVEVDSEFQKAQVFTKKIINDLYVKDINILFRLLHSLNYIWKEWHIPPAFSVEFIS
jgi:hypothetical protein